MPSRAQMLAAQRRPQRIVTPEPVPVISPIKGWNTRDPFEAMDPQDAVLLDNLFPDYGGVVSRGGSITHATGMGTQPVRTLAEFYTGAARKLMAASGGAIYDVSSPGQISIPVASGFGPDAWQTIVFNDKQFWVNGANEPQVFDGSSFADAGFTGAGLTPSTLNGVGVFNNRLYFWTGQDSNFWFGAVNAITGTLSKFPLATVTEAGGKLLAVQLLTYDGGTGISDYKCFFFDTGEVMIYQGTDPSNPTNWALVGRYTTPPAIALRAVLRYGGDIYISTQTDHLQISQILTALKLGEAPPRSKISGAQTAAWIVGSGLTGWQAFYYALGTRLIFNIPTSATTFDQHVYNTSTKAWARFRDQNAYCWGSFNGLLYFGASLGTVYRADIGGSDITQEGPSWGSSWDIPWTTTTTQSIAVNGEQAWQTLTTLMRKRLTAIRPVVQFGGSIGGQYRIKLAYDFRLPAAEIDVVSHTEFTTPWGSPWGSPWSSEITVDVDWLIAEGTGTEVGITLSAQEISRLTWLRTDVIFEPGRSL